MRRVVPFLALALLAGALAPSFAQAQVVYVQPARAYYVAPAPVVRSYVVPQSSVTYAPSYSYYSGPPIVVQSAPAPVVTYSAPATIMVPAGHYETRTYHGFGIFRPRGTYTETYYRP